MVSAKKIFDDLYQFLLPVYGEEESTGISFLLLEHFYGLRRTEILSGKMIPEMREILNGPLKRLIDHEPVQYVIGETDFYGLTFKVRPDVLIPRPETEELVQWIINENKHQDNLRILDIGTGSGCIAIALAKNLCADVTAIDFSEKALQTAEENANLNQVAIKFQHIDILSPGDHIIKSDFDIIVSNPPYVTNAERSLMKPNVLEYEPHMALFVPDNDALVFYKAILERSRQWLKRPGKIYFEINENLGGQMTDLFEDLGFKEVVLKKDLSGKDRMIAGSI